MQFKLSTYQKLKSEQGIFLALGAVIGLALIFMVFTLGYQTSQVRYASTVLRKETQEICDEIRDDILSPRFAAIKFREKINLAVALGKIPLSRITKAKLVIPTMSEGNSVDGWTGDFIATGIEPGGDDCPSGPPPGGYGDFVPAIPEDGGRSIHAVTGGAACNLDNPDECRFVGNMCAIEAVRSFPRAMWDNLQNAGNTVGCEITAEVNPQGAFTRPREITSRAAIWLPVRGRFPEGSAVTIPNYRDGYSMGLSLGIATQLTTRASDIRFRFSDFDTAGGAGYVLNINPLTGFDPAPIVPHPMSYISQPSPGMAVPPLSPLSGDSVSGGNLPVNPPDQSRPIDSIFSDRAEMYVACMNPAVLVRNLFTSTLVELAMRHGQLRNMTEVYSINPQHRNPDDAPLGAFSEPPPAAAVQHAFPNPPVRMIGFGQDLAKRLYSMPYVFYYGGTNTHTDYGPDINFPNGEGFLYTPFGRPIGLGNKIRDGFVNPFDSPLPGDGRPAWSLSLRAHHHLIAAQLRICYDLYRGETGGLPGGIDRLYPSPDFFDWHSSGQPVTPTEFFPYVQNDNGFWQYFTLREGAVAGWDQANQSGDLGCNSAGSRCLTGPELVSSLGSSQMCPYRQAGLDNPPFWNYTDIVTNPAGTPGVQPYPGGICVKPPPSYATGADQTIPPNEALPGDSNPDTPYLATFDLRPDIVGFLRSVIPSGGLPNQAISALNSPGLFPLNTGTPDPVSGVNDLAQPLGGGNYTSNPHPYSNVVLVLHRAISQRIDGGYDPTAPQGAQGDPNDEPEAIRRIIQNNFNADNKRTITVVYFPTTRMEASPQAIDTLRWAFNDATGAQDNEGNRVFVFSPNDPKYDGGALPGYDLGTPEGEALAFSRYWERLLSPVQLDFSQGTLNPENNMPLGPLSQSDEYIVKAARDIFFNRVVSRELKF